MNFRELKSKLFINGDEIIINKKVNIQGKELLLLSFIKGEESNNLYALYKGNKEIKEEVLFEPDLEGEESDFYEEKYPNTNREELVNSANTSKESLDIFLKEMTIQKQIVTFQSACAGAVEYYDWSEMVIIQHFIKNGMIPGEFDEVNIENMIIARFEQSEDEDFPEINLNKDIEITLLADERSEEELIQYPFTVKLGKLEKDTRIYYEIKSINKKNYFYLDEINRYDIWKDVDENLENLLNNIEEDEREGFRLEYLSCIDEQCPKEKDLLAICYETPDNSQLRFLAKEYLDAKPNYSQSTSLMFMVSDNGKGINENKQYVDYLIPIEKDFNDNLEIELFSRYVHIPSEVITFKI